MVSLPDVLNIHSAIILKSEVAAISVLTKNRFDVVYFTVTLKSGVIIKSASWPKGGHDVAAKIRKEAIEVMGW